MNAPVQNATNEPNADPENVTNEPTVDPENVTNEPTVDPENVTNEQSWRRAAPNPMKIRSHARMIVEGETFFQSNPPMPRKT
jgi:hypothetical protein